MKGEKQLFGRNGNIAPQKHQETQLRVTDSGRIIFPSQEKIFGQLDHILGVFKNSEAEIREQFWIGDWIMDIEEAAKCRKS